MIITIISIIIIIDMPFSFFTESRVYYRLHVVRVVCIQQLIHTIRASFPPSMYNTAGYALIYTRFIYIFVTT